MRHRRVVGTKSTRSRILGSRQAFLIVDGSVRRLNVAHVHDGIDRTADTGYKDSSRIVAVRVLVRLNVHNGAFPDVSLKEARQEAERWRAVVRSGTDAIKERERQRREAERNVHALGDIAEDAFESRKAELKGDGKAGRWLLQTLLYRP